MTATQGSLWAIHVWEVAACLAVLWAAGIVVMLMDPRVRRNRAIARRRRRSERNLVHRLRSW